MMGALVAKRLRLFHIRIQSIDSLIICGDKIDSKWVKGASERCYGKNLENPADIEVLKVNSRNTRKRFVMC